MDPITKTDVAPMKEWAAPELKKIDLEEITAGSIGSADDGLGGES